MESEPAEEPQQPEAEAASVEVPVTEVAARVLAQLDLSGADSPHEHLTESALWLALVNLDPDRAQPDLEALLAGRSWEPLSSEPVDDPHLQRVALGLILQRHAADSGAGVAERAMAALSAVALGCLDPRAGARLQHAFGRLRLLEIVEQIPVALPIRMLTLEFRHLPLRADQPDPIPSNFAARVEDLLDRLDDQGLLEYSLADHPDEEHPGLGLTRETLLEALVQTRSPAMKSLARVLLDAEAAFTSAADLLAAVKDAAPTTWGRKTPEAELRDVERRYAALHATLANTPFVLAAPGSGRYGRQMAERGGERSDRARPEPL